MLRIASDNGRGKVFWRGYPQNREPLPGQCRPRAVDILHRDATKPMHYTGGVCPDAPICVHSNGYCHTLIFRKPPYALHALSSNAPLYDAVGEYMIAGHVRVCGPVRSWLAHAIGSPILYMPVELAGNDPASEGNTLVIPPSTPCLAPFQLYHGIVKLQGRQSPSHDRGRGVPRPPIVSPQF